MLLNDAHYRYRVNVIDYWEHKPNGQVSHFTWITQLPVSSPTVYPLIRAGRCRWRIENETFNTLKNQGYHFEHNYGHGYNQLCSVMTMLMMLAFLIDQIQLLCCKTYQQARQHASTWRTLFETLRVLFKLVSWSN